MFKLFELIEIGKKEGKNMDIMLSTITQMIDNGKKPFEIFSELYEEIYGNHLCNSFCAKFIDNMYNSTEKGQKWTLDQTNEVARKVNITFNNNTDDYTQYEFWCAMHMMYYDYSEVFVESNINADPTLYAKMADAYLEDIDAPKDKLVKAFFANKGIAK